MTMAGSASDKGHISVPTMAKREEWGHSCDFLLSCLAYIVGMANIWRFPYLCLRNGGGSFLIPYFLTLIISGVPMFLLEVSIGQYGKVTPITMWRICPLFKGVGWCTIMIVLSYTVYSNSITMWILYYLGSSFMSTLPWTTCDNSWNTDACLSTFHKNLNVSGTNFNASVNTSGLDVIRSANGYLETNDSEIISNRSIIPRSPSEEFWQFKVLELSAGIGYPGGIKWDLLLCHFASWLLMALILIKGIKSAAKVVYVTGTLPYLLLTILLIYGCTLPGSSEGIKFYLRPTWSKLKDPRIWAEGFLQIFYTMGPGWGNMLTFASYNKFNNNVVRDSLIASFGCCLTSFYGGFVVFAFMGYMSQVANVPIDQVLTSGPGLAFIVYPEALGSLPLPQLWSVFFFLTLLTVLIDSLFGAIECFLSSIRDEFPDFFCTERRKRILYLAFFACQTLVGLIFCTRAGMYIFQIWDWYMAAGAITIVVLFEALTISWIYGADRFCKDIKRMVGYEPNIVWKFLWGVLDPMLILIVFFYNWWIFTTPSYGDYEYPVWAHVFGWFLGTVVLIPIPCFMLVELKRHDGNLIERLKKSIEPTSEWTAVASLSKEEEKEEGVALTALPLHNTHS